MTTKFRSFFPPVVKTHKVPIRAAVPREEFLLWESTYRWIVMMWFKCLWHKSKSFRVFIFRFSFHFPLFAVAPLRFRCDSFYRSYYIFNFSDHMSGVVRQHKDKRSVTCIFTFSHTYVDTVWCSNDQSIHCFWLLHRPSGRVMLNQIFTCLMWNTVLTLHRWCKHAANLQTWHKFTLKKL